MLWLKAFHVIFVVTWFAGLFYLPRLFIYHTEAGETVVRQRLHVMARRLLSITHIGGALAVSSGIALMIWWSIRDPSYLFGHGWFPVKLLLVLGLVGYHIMLIRLTHNLARNELHWSSRRLRLFNELPALFLIAIVILVVVQPF